MSCCGGASRGGCGSGGGCCGGSGGGCGGGGCGGGGFSRAPAPANPQLVLALDRAVVAGIANAVAKRNPHETISLRLDDPRGIVLKDGELETIAEVLLVSPGETDPVDGFSYEKAARAPSHVDVVVKDQEYAELQGYAAHLVQALAMSKSQRHVFLGVATQAPMLFSVRPLAYKRFGGSGEYRRAIEEAADRSAEAGSGSGVALPVRVQGGYVVEGVARRCEMVRGAEFLYGGKVPAHGQQVVLRVSLGEEAPLPNVVLTGEVTELLRSEPTFAARAQVYLTQEFVGRVPELEGQWSATLAEDPSVPMAPWQMDAELRPVSDRAHWRDPVYF